ncbi:MAG TPA: PhzF family phenazine biosynthesis protein [Bryobacteraceae bacterium]|nr:PhzF family phenazine biosynthesis protein [Bryobacteraceae bacterium]
MEVTFYQVDAFTRELFKGNPAAVCPLNRWLDTAVMQAIALENNLAETAFFVPDGPDGKFHIRWFTPTTEVDLCGHATLASAWVVMNRVAPGLQHVTFDSRSGPLTVSREDDLYALDFPARPGRRITPPEELVRALGREPEEVWKARDLMCVFNSEGQVRDIAPDMTKLATLDTFAVIVSAPGTDVDFVSRFFAPSRGVPEDPVTGSAHCTLIPYWAETLGKQTLRARQISSRGGELFCELKGDRVKIAGNAALYCTGTIHLP